MTASLLGNLLFKVRLHWLEKRSLSTPFSQIALMFQGMRDLDKVVLGGSMSTRYLVDALDELHIFKTIRDMLLILGLFESVKLVEVIRAVACVQLELLVSFVHF